MATPPLPYGSKELFRYVKLAPTEIVDLSRRANANKDAKAVLKLATAERKKWARDFLRSQDAISDESDLQFDYFGKLDIAAPGAGYLPTRHNLRDGVRFDAAGITEDAAYRRDAANCLLTTLAHKLLRDDLAAAKSGRLLQFVEAFPRLGRTATRKRYAPVVIDRFTHKPPERALLKHDEARDTDNEKKGELTRLMQRIDLLWRARNAHIKARRKDLEESRRRMLASPTFVAGAASTSKKGGKASTSSAAESRKHREELNARRTALAKAQDEYEEERFNSTLKQAVAMAPAQLAGAMPALSVTDVREAQADVIALKEMYGLP
jgi:hypothetical protein